MEVTAKVSQSAALCHVTRVFNVVSSLNAGKLCIDAFTPTVPNDPGVIHLVRNQMLWIKYIYLSIFSPPELYFERHLRELLWVCVVCSKTSVNFSRKVDLSLCSNSKSQYLLIAVSSHWLGSQPNPSLMAPKTQREHDTVVLNVREQPWLWGRPINLGASFIITKTLFQCRCNEEPRASSFQQLCIQTNVVWCVIMIYWHSLSRGVTSRRGRGPGRTSQPAVITANLRGRVAQGPQQLSLFPDTLLYLPLY